jgi:hypothetical protein
MPSTTYATNASPNFFLISNFFSSARYRLVTGSISAINWCTGKDSNLRTSLGGTDLQSVGFNHSPTCANPGTSNKHTPPLPATSKIRETDCGIPRLLGWNYTRRKLLDGMQYYECVITLLAA